MRRCRPSPKWGAAILLLERLKGVPLGAPLARLVSIRFQKRLPFPFKGKLLIIVKKRPKIPTFDAPLRGLSQYVDFQASKDANKAIRTAPLQRFSTELGPLGYGPKALTIVRQRSRQQKT